MLFPSPGRALRTWLACFGLAASMLVAAPPARAQPRKPAPEAKPRPDPRRKQPAKPPTTQAPRPSTATPAAPAASAVETPVGASGSGVALQLAIQRATLDNGLRVVLNVDRTSPTVAVAVVYDVGSRNEERGRSGFAHLFEHMMFQGSANVPRGEHFRMVSAHGGVLNGTTSSDRTNYYEIVPANELALALWLEADRMRSLDVSEANFENQRKVVQEEYRMRVSNAPYVPSSIRLEELVFQGYWPYEHSTIGSMADLDAAQLLWVREFYERHYAPNNAALVISGDFHEAEAMALVRRYFDAIPRAAVPAFTDVPFPEQTSQRTAIIKDVNVRNPGVLYGWAIPPARSPDHYALELAAVILGDGESSRLHQVLVRDRALAQHVSATTEDRRGPDLFAIDAQLADGVKVSDVERALEAEVKALGGARGPTDAEMRKAHRRAQAGLVLGLQSNISRATRLGEYEIFHGDARLLNSELGRYLAVTRDDVKRVAAQHLGPTRRTIVETYPADVAARVTRGDPAPPVTRGDPAPPVTRGDPAPPVTRGDPAPPADAAGRPPAAKKPAANRAEEPKRPGKGEGQGKGKGPGKGSGDKKKPGAGSTKKKP